MAKTNTMYTDKALTEAILAVLSPTIPFTSKALCAVLRKKQGISFSEKRFGAIKKSLIRKGLIAIGKEGITLKKGNATAACAPGKCGEKKKCDSKKPCKKSSCSEKKTAKKRGTVEEVPDIGDKKYNDIVTFCKLNLDELQGSIDFPNFLGNLADYIKSCQLLAYAILKKLRTGTKKEGKTLAAVCIDPKDLGTVEKVALEILYDLGLIERTATYFHLKTEN